MPLSGVLRRLRHTRLRPNHDAQSSNIDSSFLTSSTSSSLGSNSDQNKSMSLARTQSVEVSSTQPELESRQPIGLLHDADVSEVSRPRRDNFSVLAPDILWHIVSCLSYADILRLRQCSHWLCKITQDSAAWRTAFYDWLQDLEYLPLFYGGAAQQTALDMERIVCGFPRFIASVEAWGKSDGWKRELPLPSTVVAEVVSIPELERLGEQISSFRFVPGGKLLLLTSPSIIQLWDLGVSELLKPRCLASCERALTPREERARAEGRELKEGEIVICLIDELDGKILFSLSLSSDSTRQADSFYSMLMYTIEVETEQPTFECIGRFSSFSPKANTYGYDGDKIFFSCTDPNDRVMIGVHYWKEDITFQWYSNWSHIHDVELIPESNLVVCVTTHHTEVDCYKCPQLSDHPNAKAGQVYTIDNGGLYFWTWERELEAIGDFHSVATVSCVPWSTRDTAESKGNRRWESILRLKEQREVVFLEQVWRLFHSVNPDEVDLPTWWAPSITRTVRIPSSHFPLEKHDSLFSMTVNDTVTVLWWEDAKTESTMRIYVLGTGSDQKPNKDAFHGFLEKIELDEEHEGFGPLNYNRCCFSPLLGRMCLVNSDGKGFKVKQYDYTRFRLRVSLP
ncbi:hypothetical protein DL96DRAFT_1572381, partial [Flagelloscypha sp. PMI_526]